MGLEPQRSVNSGQGTGEPLMVSELGEKKPRLSSQVPG